MNIIKMMPATVKQKFRTLLHQTLPLFPLGKELQIKHHGYKVFVDSEDHCGREIFIMYLLLRRWAHEQYEQAIVRNLIQRLGVCWVVDVGASYGMYSLLGAKLKEKSLVSKIIAIEASPKTCIWLNKTIKANNLEETIQVKNAAAAAVDGKDLAFHSHPDHSEWSRVTQGEQENSHQKSLVKSVRLDNLLESAGWEPSIPLFVKMDIEGGEPNAVEGIRQSLNKAENYFLVVEFHVGLLDQVPDGAMKFAKELLGLNAAFIYELSETRECLTPLPDERSFQALVDRCRSHTQLSKIMTNIVIGTQSLSDMASPPSELR